MCLIIHKPDAQSVIPADILDNAAFLNPDGFGITYLDGKRETIKTTDYREAFALLDVPRAFVAHFRYATRGKVNLSNCHPFPFKKGQSAFQLYGNGTVADLGCDRKTDTETVAEFLRDMPLKHWDRLLAMTETRFAIVRDDGQVTRSGVWHERGGVFYSKANCFPTRRGKVCQWETNPTDFASKGIGEMTDAEFAAFERGGDWRDDYFLDSETDWFADDELEEMTGCGDLLAVYGTLKRGRGNNRLLETSEYLGEAKTLGRFRMTASGVPFVHSGEHPDGSPIAVEVYRPDSVDTWEALDCLENHPDWYYREKTAVVFPDGEELECWLYFMPDQPAAGETLISKY